MPALRGRSGSRSMSRGSRSRKRSRGASPRPDRNFTSTVIRKPGSMNGKVYKFTRWADVGAIYSTTNSLSTGTCITAASPDIISQLYSQLDILPNYAEFQALFSQYRITQLEFHFLNCMYTEVNGPQGGVNGNNLIRNFPVYIGTQRETLGTNTILQIQQEEGVTIRDYVNNGKPLIIKVEKPSINELVADSTNTGVVAGEKSGQWIDTAFADIPHRGVFIGLQDAWNSLGQPAAPNPNRAYTVRVKLSLEFKGVR